jgi:ParB/RepB/Spo0J family partition protein
MKLEHLNVSDISIDSEFNCRSIFTVESIGELSESIGMYKQMMPVLVALQDGQPYLVAGFRRLRAIKLLREPKVWCIVTDLDLHTARVLNLLENIERKQLSTWEEATAVWSIFGKDWDTAAKELRRPKRWVMCRIKLVGMAEPIQKAVHSGRLSEGQLRMLQRLKTQPARLKKMNQLLSEAYKETEPTVRSNRAVNKMMAKLCELGVTGVALKTLHWMIEKSTDDELLKFAGEQNASHDTNN